MRTERALRYLLLRHLEPFEAVVARERFREVTGSLRVAADREGFDVRWSQAGEPRERRFARGEFTFYARGDRRPEMRDLGEALATRNDATARAFAEAVFGCAAPPPAAVAAGARDPYRVAAAVGALAFGAALWWPGRLGPGASAAVALWLLAEHAPAGRLLAGLPLLGIAWLAPAPAGLAASLAYAALQLLDPDPRWLALRLALCAAAAGIAGLRLTAVAPGAAELVLAGLAVALAAQRSLFAQHLRAAPLALPFLVAGLALAGELRPAGVGLLGIALGAVAVAMAHRLRPVRSGG